MKAATLISLALFANGAIASPCSGVDRSLQADQRAVAAPIIERDLKAKLDSQVSARVRVGAVDVLHVFRVGRWQVFHVNNHATDDPYVFYADEPSRSKGYVTVWGGAAARNEGPEIERWVVAKVPAIPHQLASCFAWYVTEGLAQSADDRVRVAQ